MLDAVRAQRLTWRAAADALDISADELLDLAVAHGVSVTIVEPDDIATDLETLRKLEEQRSTEA